VGPGRRGADGRDDQRAGREPDNPTTLYAGGTTLYKSTDGGTTWSPASSGLPTGSAMSIALLPATPDTVYAGLSTGGIWKSVNGGSTW